jgi:hypothetical protein
MTISGVSRGMRRGLGMVLLLCLGACQAGGSLASDSTGDPVSIGRGTQRVVINYLIAHGMAESYVMSGRATAADLLDLVRFDHSALVALRGHEADPNWTSLKQAAGAVSALMDYTTTMDIAASPSRPRAASR